MRPVPAAIIQRALAKLLRRVERPGAHITSITDNIVIVSMPLICISPIVIILF
jgi:hypothetical protein